MSDSENLIKVENISKKYCRRLKRSLWYGVKDLAKELTGQPLGTRLRNKEFWAVRDVSFSLRRGEALGIIGPNGAGKSTLLKMLNGLIKPNTGSIRMRGRVQALIELGAGFNPILTGKENIYINAAVLGIPRKQVDRKLDEIIAFAELEEFIDTPLQSYSSGMKVRLGFAIAINMRPDVLIIDEVLAVGDQRFRRKARNAMAKLLEQDVALIFISHNIHEVIGITQKAMWIEKGRVKMMGDSPSVCAEYLYRSRYEEELAEDTSFEYMDKRSGELVVEEVVCRLGARYCGRIVTVDGPERDLRLDLNLTAKSRIDEQIAYLFQMKTLDDTNVGYVVINDFVTATAGQKLIRCFVIDLAHLHAGRYQVSFEIGTEGGPNLEGIKNLVLLDVQPSRKIIDRKHNDGRLDFARMLSNSRGPIMLPVTVLESEGWKYDGK